VLSPFFILATLSPSRQISFRKAVAAHLLLLLGCLGWAHYRPLQPGPIIGYVLLTAGIVEGAALLGWRLTQLPKSQALEFLLVSPMRPLGVFLAEAFVGSALLALVTLAGLPVLLLLVAHGILADIDVAPFLVMPFTWGAVTGLGLIVWAYEPLLVRRCCEKIFLLGVVVYLIVGVLAGEHLGKWIGWLPGGLGPLVLHSVEAFHRYNPFAVVKFWMEENLAGAWVRMTAVESAALILVGLLLIRSACRLHGHFHDRHYRPALDSGRSRAACPDDRPLSWWAVRRVTEYSGRVNLWLAGGFGILYALYTVAGASWPPWLGRRIFMIFDDAGGVPLWAAALVVLAAVPAAFQYGLWDSSKQERCRRLELLLLSRLNGRDYWEAAFSAAWHRGRGYFVVALLLWTAAALTRPDGLQAAIAGLATGVLLWTLYFALGFRGFARGVRANSMGMWLTVGLPAAAFLLQQLGWSYLAALLPPGTVYHSAGSSVLWVWLPGAIAAAVFALIVSRRALATCEEEMRNWYDKNHGRLVAD
jgi:hypothetical protein